MGNLRNEIMYKLGFHKDKVKLILFQKNNKLIIQYVPINKDNKLVMSKKKAEGMQENITVDSFPILDESTSQPVYFNIEGTKKTIDLHKTQKDMSMGELDDLMLSAAFERGRNLERHLRDEQIKQRSITTILLIGVAVIGVFNLAASYMTLTNLPA